METQETKPDEGGSSWFSTLVVLGVVAVGAILYAKYTKKI